MARQVDNPKAAKGSQNDQSKLEKDQKRPIPPGWTQIWEEERPGGKKRSKWQCPHRSIGLGNVKLRCTVSYRRSRIGTKHEHRMRPVFGSIPDESSDASMTSGNELRRKLAYLAGKLNISARAVASETMDQFVLFIVKRTLKFVEENPAGFHDPAEIFTGTSRANIAMDLIAGAKVLVDRALANLATCAVTLQMDAGTIHHHHFLDYVVSFPQQDPFLIRSEFRDSFDRFAYAEVTSDVISELSSHGVTVAAITADNLIAQQVGLRLMIEESPDPAVRRCVICLCANHTLNLVFQCELKSNLVLQDHLGSFREFQRIMRTGSAIRQYGKMCPTFPETRWFYISEVMHWVIREAKESELIPFLMTCIAQKNDVGKALKGEALRGTEFRHGRIPEWIDKVHSVIAILETLSKKFESRQCGLWMVVPLIERAKSDLLERADAEEVEWIRDLAYSLALRLTARFRQTFNSEAAIAAYLLSSEGRIKFSAPGRPLPQRGLGWFNHELLLPHTAEEVIENERTKDYCEDLEIRIGDKELTKEEMAELLVKEPEGVGVSVDDNNPEEISIAEFATQEVQDPDHVPDYGPIYREESAPGSYKEELEFLRQATRSNLDRPVFKDLLVTASHFLCDFASRFEFADEMDVPDLLLRWLTQRVPWDDFLEQSPEIMWGLVVAEGWENFAELARRLVGIIPSESEVERTISIQRSIMGMKGTQFGQQVFTARTQIHQIDPAILFNV
jgi:hypothetical protein